MKKRKEFESTIKRVAMSKNLSDSLCKEWGDDFFI